MRRVVGEETALWRLSAPVHHNDPVPSPNKLREQNRKTTRASGKGFAPERDDENRRLRWVQENPTHQHENSGPLHRDRLFWLAAQVKSAGGGPWLVAGSGGGYLEQSWPLAAPPLSLDLSFDLARAQGGVQANLLRLPFAGEVFGGVVASEVLEHLADAAAGAREIFRVMRPGGVLLVSVPNGFALEGLRGRFNPHPHRGHHLTRLPPQGWRALLAQAGFVVRAEAPITLLPYIPYFMGPLKRLEDMFWPPALDSTRRRVETGLAPHPPFARLGQCHGFVCEKP